MTIRRLPLSCPTSPPKPDPLFLPRVLAPDAGFVRGLIDNANTGAGLPVIKAQSAAECAARAVKVAPDCSAQRTLPLDSNFFVYSPSGAPGRTPHALPHALPALSEEKDSCCIRCRVSVGAVHPEDTAPGLQVFWLLLLKGATTAHSSLVRPCPVTATRWISIS